MTNIDDATRFPGKDYMQHIHVSSKKNQKSKTKVRSCLYLSYQLYKNTRNEIKSQKRKQK